MSCIIYLLFLVIGASQMRCAHAADNSSKANLTEEWLSDQTEYRSILNDWKKLVEEECDLSDSEEDVWHSLFKYHNSNGTSSMNDQHDLRQRYRQELETNRKIMEFYKKVLKYCKPRICPESTIAPENIASTEDVSTQSFTYTTQGSVGLTTTSIENEEHLTNGHSTTMNTKVITTTTQTDVSTRSENDISENAWIVFQRRQDGSVNFNQNWDAYVNGFGELDGEFWAGLDMIHNRTKDGNYKLRIDMVDTTGIYWYAEYSTFMVGSPQTNYTLTTGGYSGNATDAIAYGRHSQKQFSTSDADNDRWSSGNCANKYGGGWWYNACYYSLLNGFYQSQISWYQPGRGAIKMRFSEMKTRKSIS